MRAIPINDDGILLTGKVKIKAVALTPDGTNTATLKIFDSSTATLDEDIRDIFLRAKEDTASMGFDGGLLLTEGVYALLEGTGGKGVLYVE